MNRNRRKCGSKSGKNFLLFSQYELKGEKIMLMRKRKVTGA